MLSDKPKKMGKYMPARTPEEIVEMYRERRKIDDMKRQEELVKALWDYARNLKNLPPNCKEPNTGFEISLKAVDIAVETILSIFNQKRIEVQ